MKIFIQFTLIIFFPFLQLLSSFLHLLLPRQHYVLSLRNKLKTNKINPPTGKHVNETHNMQIDKRLVKQIVPKKTKQKVHELEH